MNKSLGGEWDISDYIKEKKMKEALKEQGNLYLSDDQKSNNTEDKQIKDNNPMNELEKDYNKDSKGIEKDDRGNKDNKDDKDPLKNDKSENEKSKDDNNPEKDDAKYKEKEPKDDKESTEKGKEKGLENPDLTPENNEKLLPKDNCIDFKPKDNDPEWNYERDRNKDKIYSEPLTPVEEKPKWDYLSVEYVFQYEFGSAPPSVGDYFYFDPVKGEIRNFSKSGDYNNKDALIYNNGNIKWSDGEKTDSNNEFSPNGKQKRENDFSKGIKKEEKTDFFREDLKDFEEMGLQGASKEDIKQNYYNLAKKYHPDINRTDTQAAEKFQDISRAYNKFRDNLKDNLIEEDRKKELGKESEIEKEYNKKEAQDRNQNDTVNRKEREREKDNCKKESVKRDDNGVKKQVRTLEPSEYERIFHFNEIEKKLQEALIKEFKETISSKREVKDFSELKQQLNHYKELDKKIQEAYLNELRQAYLNSLITVDDDNQKSKSIRTEKNTDIDDFVSRTAYANMKNLEDEKFRNNYNFKTIDKDKSSEKIENEVEKSTNDLDKIYKNHYKDYEKNQYFNESNKILDKSNELNAKPERNYGSFNDQNLKETIFAEKEVEGFRELKQKLLESLTRDKEVIQSIQQVNKHLDNYEDNLKEIVKDKDIEYNKKSRNDPKDAHKENLKEKVKERDNLKSEKQIQSTKNEKEKLSNEINQNFINSTKPKKENNITVKKQSSKNILVKKIKNNKIEICNKQEFLKDIRDAKSKDVLNKKYKICGATVNKKIKHILGVFGVKNYKGAKEYLKNKDIEEIMKEVDIESNNENKSIKQNELLGTPSEKLTPDTKKKYTRMTKEELNNRKLIVYPNDVLLREDNNDLEIANNIIMEKLFVKDPISNSNYENSLDSKLQNFNIRNEIDVEKSVLTVFDFLDEELEFLKEEHISIQDSDSKWSWLTNELAEKYFISILLPYFIIKPKLYREDLYLLGFHPFFSKLKKQKINFSDIKNKYLNLDKRKLIEFLYEKFGTDKVNKKIENAKNRLENFADTIAKITLWHNRTKLKLLLDLGFFPIKCKECDISVDLLIALQLHHPTDLKQITLNDLRAVDYNLTLKKFKNDKVELLCINHHREKQLFYPITFKDIIFKENLFSMSAEEIDAYIDDYLSTFTKTGKYREIINEQYALKNLEVPLNIITNWKYQIKKWIKKRFVFNELFSGKCIICGDSNLLHLDLHHTDSDWRIFVENWQSITKLDCNDIMRRIIQDKCVCLCANCHALITYKYHISTKEILKGFFTQQEIDKISEEVTLRYNDAIERISNFKYDLTNINFKDPIKLEFSQKDAWKIHLMTVFYFIEIKERNFFLRNEIIYDLGLAPHFISGAIKDLIDMEFVQKSDSSINYSLTQKGINKSSNLIQEYSEKANEIKKKIEEILNDKDRYEFLDYVYSFNDKCYLKKKLYSKEEIKFKYCITIFDLISNKGINEFTTRELALWLKGKNYKDNKLEISTLEISMSEISRIGEILHDHFMPFNLIEKVESSTSYQRINPYKEIDKSKILISSFTKIYRLTEKGFDIAKNGFDSLEFFK